MNTTVLEKIQSELERSGCDAFLLSGGDNMRYAAQVHLPFTDEHPGLAFVLFAKGRLPLVLSPSLWARSWERGIISDVRAYPGSLDATHAAAELAAFLRPLGLASIGLDMNRASVALREALGDKKFTNALKRYYNEFCYKIAKPEDMVSCFEKVGVDVAGFFASYVEGKAVI